jgi:hypothetical protein
MNVKYCAQMTMKGIRKDKGQEKEEIKRKMGMEKRTG